MNIQQAISSINSRTPDSLPEMHISLGGTGLNETDILSIQTALSSHKIKGLTLSFTGFLLDEIECTNLIVAVSAALSSGSAPAGLTLDFNGKEFTCEDIARLSQALSSGLAPNGLTLKLDKTNLTLADVVSLSTAISSGQAPQDLVIWCCSKRT